MDIWSHERRFWNSGHLLIAGVDEVGRGPLAGPVIAAAVILDESCETDGITDSKALSPSERLILYPRIVGQAKSWGVGMVDVETIDDINILQATFQAMRQALDGMASVPQGVLVDGKAHIPGIRWPQRAIIKGDRDCISIGAASILAKEIRDRIMEEYDTEYPEYGFARHKGYATPEHLDALEKHGPCPIHRKSFAPIRGMRQRALVF